MEGLSQFTPFILMAVIVYFFMIAPQMKRAKKEKAFSSRNYHSLFVVSTSGCH